MVGLVQKLLFDFIEVTVDAEAVDEIRRRAGISPQKTFRMDEVYDDLEWQRLFRTTCDYLSVTQEEGEKAFAAHFMKDALVRWPKWFQMSRNSQEFLQRQPTIHNSFATGIHQPQARSGITDKFRIETFENAIITHYKSENKLCGLYICLAREVIQHYSDDAVIEERYCMKKGAHECEIHIEWRQKKAN